MCIVFNIKRVCNRRDYIPSYLLNRLYRRALCLSSGWCSGDEHTCTSFLCDMFSNRQSTIKHYIETLIYASAREN